MPVFVPNTAAPTHVGRFREALPTGLAFALGVPFLTGVFGPQAAIAVEAAFGADVTADPSSWNWYDITGDVRQADGGGISITPIGRADESSTAQPAGCGFELANDSGNYTAYSRGSRWWPNVRRNTPIRVRVNLTGLAGDWVIRFQGEVTGWTPSWDVSAALPVVTVAATGVTRRLSQGKTPLSSMRRSVDFGTVRPVAYWPLEDGRDVTVSYDVISSAPSVFGPPALTVNGNAGAVQLGTADLGLGSLPVANISGGGKLYLYLPSVVATGQVTFSWSVAFGTDIRTGTYTTVGIHLNPATAPLHLQWDTIANDDGTVRLLCYEIDAGDNLVGGPLDTTFAGAENFFDGQPRVFQLNLAASGGTNVAWALYENDSLRGSGTITPSFSGAMNAPPWRVSSFSLAPAGKTVSYGHVGVWTTNITPGRYSALNAHRGETATDRLARLCAEQGIAIAVTGASITTMGPQGVDAFLPLLRECETADQGVLYDGLGPGLGYVTRDARYNATPVLTIDVAGGQLDDPFEPVDDDQRDRNVVKADRKNGGSYTYSQVSGPKGTDAIGVYDTSLTVNVQSDGVLPYYASWLTHLGTVEGFRYPNLNLDLYAVPAIAAGWLAAGISGRIDLLNVAAVAPQHPTGTVRDLLEGWAEQLSPFTWTVQANTSQYDGWKVGVLAADVGDTNPLVGHLDTDNSATSGTTAPGASTIAVVTNAGPVWTTAADDFPFDVLISGQRVSIASVSGATSPQTFNVDPAGSQVLYSIPAGSPVNVADALVLAL
jgi:hypothetical protein